MARARAIVDAADAAELPALREQVAAAMERHNVASGIVFSLDLGGQHIEGFLSDNLNDLYGATDPAARAEFDTARSAAAARRQEAEITAQIQRERGNLDNFLHDLDQPVRPPGREDVWLVHDARDGSPLVATDAQMQDLRSAAAAEVRRLCDSAENWLSTAVESQARSSSPWSRQISSEQHSWAGSEALSNAVVLLGSGGSLENAYGEAAGAVDEARRSQELASAAATDVTTVEYVITGLRLVRDASIAILGACATLGLAPAIGSVAAAVGGAAVGGGLTAGAAAEDQLVDRGRVNWQEVVTGAVLNFVGSLASAGIAPGATRALQQVVTRRVIWALTRPAMRAVLSATARATAIDVIERQVVPEIVTAALSRLSDAGGAGAAQVLEGHDLAHVESAVESQFTIQLLVRDALVAHVSQVAATLPVSETASSASSTSRSATSTTEAPSASGSATSGAPSTAPVNAESTATLSSAQGDTGSLRSLSSPPSESVESPSQRDLPPRTSESHENQSGPAETGEPARGAVEDASLAFDSAVVEEAMQSLTQNLSENVLERAFVRYIERARQADHVRPLTEASIRSVLHPDDLELFLRGRTFASLLENLDGLHIGEWIFIRPGSSTDAFAATLAHEGSHLFQRTGQDQDPAFEGSQLTGLEEEWQAHSMERLYWQRIARQPGGLDRVPEDRRWLVDAHTPLQFATELLARYPEYGREDAPREEVVGPYTPSPRATAEFNRADSAVYHLMHLISEVPSAR